jgi:uncharacterized protein (DUF885 family)
MTPRPARNVVRYLALVLASVIAAAAGSGALGADGGARVTGLADELLAHLKATSAYVRLQSGLPIGEFDPVTPENARANAAFSRSMLARLDAIDLASLAHEDWLLAWMLHQTFTTGSFADQNYWFDFAVAPYAGGLPLNAANVALASQPLKSADERTRYLKLLDSYARLLEQTAAKTRSQADRGIRVPKPAIPGVVATFRGLRASVAQNVIPAPTRLEGVPARDAAAFGADVQKRADGAIRRATDAILAIFDDAYVAAAPAEVGIGQYPGGKERYRRLITDYTGLNLTPEAIHDLGEKRVGELEGRMQAVRDSLGFKGTRDEFHEQLRKDPRFFAKSPAELEEHYQVYIARMKTVVGQYFSTLPKAPYAVNRLAPAAEKGMTYGYYDPPSPADPEGRYYFNGSDLDKRSMLTAEHLMFHELIPGHHLQLAQQFENRHVHPVRKFLDFGAFSEGWGEYAASLGEEMGLYSDPYDLYGHLILQSFLTSRLVVDTGMNYFGMPLAEARAYMKAHSLESDVQLASETLRYSTDIYGQALCYRLGFEKFWETRHRAEQALGARFDLRKFHAAAIGEGAMPLNVLDQHIDWFIGQESR